MNWFSYSGPFTAAPPSDAPGIWQVAWHGEPRTAKAKKEEKGRTNGEGRKMEEQNIGATGQLDDDHERG